MSLQGVLRDFGCAEVFQLIAQQRKTGVLEIKRRDRALEVHFLDGAVLRARPSESRPDGALASFLLRTGAISENALAEAQRRQEETLEPLAGVVVESGQVDEAELKQIRQLVTDETIFELFLWDEGRFAFKPGPVEAAPDETPTGAENVLLDAMRMRDEWARISADVANLSHAVLTNVDVERFRARRGAIAEATGIPPSDLDRIFHRVSGRPSIRRVIDLSKLGTFQGGRALVALLRDGAIRLEGRPRAGAREPGPEESRGRPLLGAAVLAACAALAVALLLAPAPDATDFPVPASGFESVREASDLERLRAALEAHRWAHGAYPGALDALEASPALLAGVRVDRYSYARQGESYWLGVRPPGDREG